MARLGHALVVATITACSAGPSGPVTTVRISPDGAVSDHYFSSVWPDDRRLDEDGYLVAADFPNPRPGGLFDSALAGSQRLVKGWGIASPIYVPFTAAIDPASLPSDAAASMRSDASIFLAAIDADSPVAGQQVPIEWKILDEPTLWLPGHVLAVRPVVGFPLRERTRYALVITTKVRDAKGAPIGPDAVFTAGLDDAGAEEGGRFFKPLAAFLDRQHISHGTVAGATVFTTQATTEELFKLRDWMEAQPRPALNGPLEGKVENGYDLIKTTYGPAPWLLHGQPPYEFSGGEIRYDTHGDPMPAMGETMRLAICLPRGAVPTNGFPVVFASHGTGGDYLTFVEDGTCALLASQGIASFGIDQVVSGTRTPPNSSCLGQSPETCFINVVNPVAARNLVRHSALDHITLRRMVEGLSLDQSQDPEGRLGGVHFDLTHFAFFGHSQGGLTGSLYAAIEENLSGALLSGAGGHITTTLLVRDNGDVKALLESPLFFNIADDEHLDQFHPALAFLQTMGDVTDPLSYGHYWIKDPAGQPKNIFMTSGLDDPYTPAGTAIALALTAGLPQLVDGHAEDPRFAMAGLTPITGPVRANLSVSGSSVTGVFRQFPGQGHFPIFNDATARDQERAFFRTLVNEGTGTVPAP